MLIEKIFHQREVATTDQLGHTIEKVEHRSDFVRLEELIQSGGMYPLLTPSISLPYLRYLDLDAIPLKSFDNLLKTPFECVFGQQLSYNHNYSRLSTVSVLISLVKMGSGLFLAKPNSTVLKEWLRQSSEVFDSKWNTHSIDLLSTISRVYADDVLVLPQPAFFPYL